MNNEAFLKQKQEAAERMRQMNQKSNPQAPSAQKNAPQKTTVKNNSLFEGIGIPFLDNLKSDGDATLILGILLLLFSEKADKKLLFALIYILL